jgi:hypothetical protein
MARERAAVQVKPQANQKALDDYTVQSPLFCHSWQTHSGFVLEKIIS